MKKPTVAIVSDNSSGVLLARLLERADHKVVLIDSGDSRTDRSSKTALSYFPATAEVEAALLHFTEWSKSELNALTIESGDLKPFVGFGGSKSPAVDVLTKYNYGSRLVPFQDLDVQIPQWRSELKAKVHYYSEISSANFSGSRLESLDLTGGTTVEADRFIFMNPPSQIPNWLPDEMLGARVRSRIAKSRRWARVSLQLHHPQPIFGQENLLFLASGSAEVDPCVGKFSPMPTNAGEHQHSVWETYIANDLSDDAEHVSGVLKAMRRMIKRAFPQMADRTPETLTVSPFAAGEFSWIHDPSTKLEIADNFAIYPPLATPYLGMAQCAVSAVAAFSWVNDVTIHSTTSPSLLGSSPDSPI